MEQRMNMHTRDARKLGESEQRTAKVVMAIVAINAWNRIAVSTRWMPV